MLGCGTSFVQGDGAGLIVVKRVSILCSNSLISSFLCCLSSSILCVMVLIAVAVILDCATTFVRLFSRPVSLDDSPAKSPDIFTVSSSNVFTCSTAVSFCFCVSLICDLSFLRVSLSGWGRLAGLGA